jgi:hypothetical protein
MKQPEAQPPTSQINPEPQLVPAGAVGWAQVPAPSQVSKVHGSPSSGQAAPLLLLTMVQPPRPLQVEDCWQLLGVQV